MRTRDTLDSRATLEAALAAVQVRNGDFQNADSLAESINQIFGHQVAVSEDGRISIGPLALSKLLKYALGDAFIGPGYDRYFIRKRSRAGNSPYAGPACDWAGVPRGEVYSDLRRAREDASRLSQANPVGFDVCDLDTGESISSAETGEGMRRRRYQ